MTTRRQFIASATALIAAHECLAEQRLAMSACRIVSLELETAAPLGKMKDFYGRLLGLKVPEDQADRLTIQAGESRITFRPAKQGRPFYHFAFNIPENKIAAAHYWQKKRSPLIPIGPQLRDPKYPDNVVDYSHWNAHSVFFFDPAGNVVEYIARHDLNNGAPGGFSSQDILCVSEIAFVVEDVAATAKKLKAVAGVEQYRGASDQFAALGDEQGLLLVMKRGRVISFDAPEKKAVTVFPTTAEVRGAKPSRYSHPEFPYRLFVNE
jgi:hypothetical protein